MRESKDEEKERKYSNLLSPILGVPPIGICQAKSESSFTQRGLHLDTKKKDFTEDPRKEISGNQNFRD